MAPSPIASRLEDPPIAPAVPFEENMESRPDPRALTPVQRALLENDDWHKDVVERGQSLLCIHDLQGRLLSVNSSAALALGYTTDELLGIPMRDLVPLEFRGAFDAYLTRIEQKGEADGFLTVMSRQGQRQTWKYHNTLRREGVATPIVRGIAYDVSEQKLAQDDLAKQRQQTERCRLDQEINTKLGFEGIIGQSSALKAVMESVSHVAQGDSTVLLLGETGTGKELIARAIHRLGNRRSNSLVKTNCTAVPSGLLESELFGHEKGAFTGAVDRKIGRLELAHRGTLFLDEIGDMPLELQPKLLRVLQDKEFERLGSTQTLNIDFRLIAATNQNLKEMVLDHEFRADLYYRLNVFPIRIPPLRERREDIPLLANAFVQKYARRMDQSIDSIPAAALEAMVQWPWPGNVRELENFIERSTILTVGSVLQAPLVELELRTIPATAGQTLDAIKREHIQQILEECRGNVSHAAARMGLNRTTLQSKLKRMGIDHLTYGRRRAI